MGEMIYIAWLKFQTREIRRETWLALVAIALLAAVVLFIFGFGGWATFVALCVYFTTPIFGVWVDCAPDRDWCVYTGWGRILNLNPLRTSLLRFFYSFCWFVLVSLMGVFGNDNAACAVAVFAFAWTFFIAVHWAEDGESLR